jgi:hypothetical protein
MSWWAWLLLAWMLLSIPVAVLVGQVIRVGQHGENCRSCSHPRLQHAEDSLACGACACPRYLSQPAKRRRWQPQIGLRRISLPVPRRPET